MSIVVYRSKEEEKEKKANRFSIDNLLFFNVLYLMMIPYLSLTLLFFILKVS